MDLDFRYDPETSALVVIDMQRDYCAPDGALARLGNDTTAAQQMAPRLENLISVAREAGVPVIFVRTTHGAHDDSPAWLNRYGTSRGDEPRGVICRDDDPVGCDWYVVEPQKRETIVTKHRYSAFAGTSLSMILRTRGIESLIFTGVATEICVESSLRHALFEEFYVSLVYDCVASFSREAHDASVAVVDANFGTVVDSETLSAMWGARAA
jgi:ureidoacrylate peracid hydrolase